MSTDLDQVRLRMVAADPAPPGTEPPSEVMTADVLLDLIDERSGIMPTSTETLEHTPSFDSRRRAWRPVWAFAGAFVVLVTAIGIAVALAGSDGTKVVDQPAPTIAETPATTAVPQTTMAAQPSVAVPPATTVPRIIPQDISWELIMPTGAEGLQFIDAISDGTTVVATGYAFAGEGSELWRPEVWRSEDGLTWEPFVGGEDLLNGIPMVGPDGIRSLSFEDDAEEYGLVEVTAVTRGAPGWIAVGRWELDGRVWFSRDGESWEQLDSTPFEGAWLMDVVAGGPGYVAVGSFHGLGEGVERAAVFVSRNGLDWGVVDTFAEQENLLGSIHVDPTDGSLLAFGNQAVWRSYSGYDWAAIHQRSAATWLSQPPPWADAVWVDDTIVAGGGDVAFSLWYSSDAGASWIRHDPADPIFDVDLNVDALVEHQGRLIAVGTCVGCTTNLRPDETPRVDATWGVIWVGTPN